MPPGKPLRPAPSGEFEKRSYLRWSANNRTWRSHKLIAVHYEDIGAIEADMERPSVGSSHPGLGRPLD